MAEETSNIAAQIVANGYGVTLASRSSIEGRTEGVSILNLKDRNSRLELGLIYAREHRELPLLRGFQEVLEKERDNSQA